MDRVEVILRKLISDGKGIEVNAGDFILQQWQIHIQVFWSFIKNLGEIIIQMAKVSNVVLDMVTGAYVQKEIDCLADGRIVIIAIMGGSKAEVNTGQILRRRLTITGSTLRPRPVSFKKQITQQLHARIWPLLDCG